MSDNNYIMAENVDGLMGLEVARTVSDMIWQQAGGARGGYWWLMSTCGWPDEW